jgi:membrane-bound lytic murein transglycosylase D
MTINAALDERLDPVAAAHGAARYLRRAHRRLGAWPLTVTSYNHGVGGMAAAKDRFGTDFVRIVKDYQGPYFGFASRNFYAEFLAAREIARQPGKFFPEGVNYAKPLANDRLVLPHSMPAHHIAAHYGLKLSALNELNAAWSPAAREGRVHLPKDTVVWLPKGTTQRVASAPPPVPALKIARASKGGKQQHLHVVKNNETLSHVASRYKVSVTTLRRLNGLAGNLIRPGQRLRVSAVSGPVKASNAGTASAGQGYYTVRRNDTLSTIAARHGQSVAELKRLNGIPRNSNLVRAGQKLRVGTEKLHVVKRGDSPAAIAARNNISLAELLSYNDLDRGDVIHPGEKVRIPLN